MALASRLGTMEQSTLVNGEKIEHMEKAVSYMLTEIYTMATGPTIRQTAVVFTNT